MKLYLVERTDIPWYGEYSSFVVLAEDVKQAIEVCRAFTNYGFDGKAKVTLIGLAAEGVPNDNGVVHSDYKN